MSLGLTPRERRWLEALLVLSTIAVGYVVLGFAARVLADFGDLLLVFFLAWLLAFILSPLVARLTAVLPFLPRVVAVVVVYAGLLGLLGVILVLVAGAVARSISDFVAGIPQLTRDLPGLLAPWEDRLRALGIQNPDLAARAQTLIENLATYADRLLGPLQGLAVASVGAIGNLLLVFILSLYVVVDRDPILAFLFRLVPPAWKDEAGFVEQSVARSFGGFLRGQATMGITYALVATATGVLLGLDYVAATAAIAGILMAIPFFGPFAAWAPPVLVAVITKPEMVVPSILIMGIGWLVVMNVIQPRVMSVALRIHPVVVLGSVLVGLKVAGIGGAIFAIPIAAVCSAIFFHAVLRAGDTGSVALRAARRLEAREGRPVRVPREPEPGLDTEIEGRPPMARQTGEAGETGV